MCAKSLRFRAVFTFRETERVKVRGFLTLTGQVVGVNLRDKHDMPPSSFAASVLLISRT